MTAQHSLFTPRGWAGAWVALVIAASCCVTLPWTASQMRVQRLDEARLPPSLSHPLGTDALGRDMLVRVLYGGAVSLGIGALAVAVAVGLGTLYGAVAGYVGGLTDAVLMRVVDVLYAMPTILIIMLLTVSLGAGLEAAGILGREAARFVVLAVSIGGVSWLTTARVVRGQVLSLRNQPFVDAARGLGLPVHRIIFRHIGPNLVGVVLVFASMTLPQAMLQEAFLSFLGIGVQPPQATWGSLVADGVEALNPVQVDWWLIVFPCGILAITLLSLNSMCERLQANLGGSGRAGPH